MIDEPNSIFEEVNMKYGNATSLVQRQLGRGLKQGGYPDEKQFSQTTTRQQPNIKLTQMSNMVNTTQGSKKSGSLASKAMRAILGHGINKYELS
jgi:hypothetical protein